MSLSPGDYREAHGTHRTLKMVSVVDGHGRQPMRVR
jgi:hypothetical protein